MFPFLITRSVWGIPESCWLFVVVDEVLLYVHRNHRFIRDGSLGRPPWLSHSSWALKLALLQMLFTCWSQLSSQWMVILRYLADWTISRMWLCTSQEWHSGLLLPVIGSLAFGRMKLQVPALLPVSEVVVLLSLVLIMVAGDHPVCCCVIRKQSCSCGQLLRQVVYVH